MTLLTLYRCNRCQCDIEYPVDELFLFKIDEKVEPNPVVLLGGGPIKVHGDLCKLCTAVIAVEYNKYSAYSFSNVQLNEIEEHEASHAKQFKGESETASAVET